MTEYDYSPDAYAKHIAKQREVASWIEDTSRYQPANPFSASQHGSTHRNTAWGKDSPRSYSSDSDGGDHSSSHRRRHGGHHDDRRHRHHRSSHSHSHGTYSAGTHHSRSSSSPPSTSYTAHPYSAPMNAYQYPTDHNQYFSSNVTPMSSSQPYTPLYPNSNNPIYVQHSSNQPLVMPIQSGTAGYIVVPPKGTSYQVISPPLHPSSPPQPWYKRVFSPVPSTSRSKSSRKKRSGNWSLDIY